MLNKIKKGDIVARISYQKDVIFVVDSVINNQIAILTGITTRLKADAPVRDLALVEKKEINSLYKSIDDKIENKINTTEIEKNGFFKRSDRVIYTGRILHLDGDKKYSEKSNLYYKKMGLKAIVRNIPENRQPSVVNPLIERYHPDILVVTRS